MLLQQQEELGPGEKDEESSQVPRSVTVGKTGTKCEVGQIKTSANLVGGTKRRKAVKRRAATSVKFYTVKYLLL